MAEPIITRLKFLPDVRRGYERAFDQCKQCGRVYYRDYQPYSRADPFLWLPCGHVGGQRYHDSVRTLPKQEGMRAMLAQHERSKEDNED